MHDIPIKQSRPLWKQEDGSVLTGLLHRDVTESITTLLGSKNRLFQPPVGDPRSLDTSSESGVELAFNSKKKKIYIYI